MVPPPPSSHLCLTLSMRAAARLLVLSLSCLLQVGQWSTLALQLLQRMWPAGQQGMGRARGTRRQTGHSTTDSRSEPSLAGSEAGEREKVSNILADSHTSLLYT